MSAHQRASKLSSVVLDRQLYSAEPVWEEPEDLRTMLDESTFEVTEEMVRSMPAPDCTRGLTPCAAGICMTHVCI